MRKQRDKHAGFKKTDMLHERDPVYLIQSNRRRSTPAIIEEPINAKHTESKIENPLSTVAYDKNGSIQKTKTSRMPADNGVRPKVKFSCLNWIQF